MTKQVRLPTLIQTVNVFAVSFSFSRSMIRIENIGKCYMNTFTLQMRLITERVAAVKLLNFSGIVKSITAVYSSTWMDHVEAGQLTEGCDECWNSLCRHTDERRTLHTHPLWSPCRLDTDRKFCSDDRQWCDRVTVSLSAVIRLLKKFNVFNTRWPYVPTLPGQSPFWTVYPDFWSILPDANLSWFPNMRPGFVIRFFRSAFFQHLSINVKLFCVESIAAHQLTASNILWLRARYSVQHVAIAFESCWLNRYRCWNSV